MPCIVDYDLDGPEFYVITTPTARKPHTCRECGDKIEPGAKYERTAGKWEGEMDTIKTCSPCAEIRKALFRSWEYGALRDYVQACADDLDAGDVDGLSIGAITKISEWIEI